MKRILTIALTLCLALALFPAGALAKTVDCPECTGGYVNPKCSVCGRSGVVNAVCTVCGGSGQNEGDECKNCYGTGNERCYECNGFSTHICGICKGKGTITKKTPAPKLSHTRLTITAGFPSGLVVHNPIGGVRWSSSNTRVVTVGRTGSSVRLNAKKAGKATITAKTGGKTLRATVTVKANTRSYTVNRSLYSYGYKPAISVSKLSYKSGKLTVNYIVFNNSPLRIIRLNNLNMSINLGSNFVIARKTISRQSVNIPAYSARSFSMKISMKNSVDLRASTPGYRWSYSSYNYYR